MHNSNSPSRPITRAWGIPGSSGTTSFSNASQRERGRLALPDAAAASCVPCLETGARPAALCASS
jgi:hypothetical protein